MSEEWIHNLASDPKSAESERDGQEFATTREQESFNAAVAPFWSAVQDELQRCVTEYNKAIGREDLTVATQPERSRSSRHQGSAADRGSFAIYRGERNWEYCKINLSSASREVVVMYSVQPGRKSDDSTATKSMTFEVVHEAGAARALIDDGTPAAVAKAILSEWASNFPSTPPHRATSTKRSLCSTLSTESLGRRD